MNKPTFLTALALLCTQSLFSAETTITKKRKAESAEESFVANKKPKTINNLLLVSLKNNNLHQLSETIQTNSNFLNQEIDFNATPLIYAAEKGNLEAVKILASHGADINLSIDGYYPLLSAAMGDKSEVAHYLIDKGAIIDQPSRLGSPLAWAIENENASLAQKIIEKSPDLSDNDKLTYNYLDMASKNNKNGRFNTVINLLKERHAPANLNYLCNVITNLDIKKASDFSNDRMDHNF
ncbi:MAG: ankyrin repeat domain-containing protein [Candidatus Dependentiae bacterium]